MRIHQSTAIFLASAMMAVGTMAFGAPHGAWAQTGTRSIQTDARWYPWLGCWQSDTSAAAQVGAVRSTSCVVPVAGSSAVEALTIVRGKVIGRDRLDASGPPRAITGQGCDGFETVSWSSNGHRVYLHSDYTCVGGTKGTSTTLFALSPTGDWLHVAEIRAGGGSIVSVDRRRNVGIGAELPPGIVRGIRRQQLAMATARAAAAVPIAADDIIEALHSADAAVVRSWLVASGQQFDLDQHQLSALARAGAPPSVMQTVMSAPARYGDSLRTAADRSADTYLNTPVYNPSITAQGYARTYQPMTTMYVCPPTGCAAPNPYSAYNGYSANTYLSYPSYPSYSYPPYPYASYPYIYSAPFGGDWRERRGPFREPKQQPVPQGPVGRRP